MHARKIATAAALAVLTLAGCSSSGHTNAGSPSTSTTNPYPTASCAAAFAHPQGSTDQKLAAIATGCRNLDDLTAALIPYAPGHDRQQAAQAAGQTKSAACLSASGPLCTSP